MNQISKLNKYFLFLFLLLACSCNNHSGESEIEYDSPPYESTTEEDYEIPEEETILEEKEVNQPREITYKCQWCGDRFVYERPGYGDLPETEYCSRKCKAESKEASGN